jgi:hypothetical protein
MRPTSLFASVDTPPGPCRLPDPCFRDSPIAVSVTLRLKLPVAPLNFGEMGNVRGRWRETRIPSELEGSMTNEDKQLSTSRQSPSVCTDVHRHRASFIRRRRQGGEVRHL